MPKLNINLPKDIQDAPLEVRESVLATLRQAMALPPVMQVTRQGGNEHNMWERNHDELLADAEDEFYAILQNASAERMAGVIAALGLSLDGVDMEKAFTPEYTSYVGLMKSKSGWMGNAKSRISELVSIAKDKRDAFLQYIQDNNPLKKNELARLDKIMRTRLPEYAKKIEEFSVRAGYIGKIRNEVEKGNMQAVGILVDRFPETIITAQRESVVLTMREHQQKTSEGKKVTILPLTPQESRAVEHATHSAADKVQEVDERHRAGIKQTILRAKKERWSPQKLQQTLYDLYGDQNRDWRRVAITELAMADNDAFLAGVENGGQVVGMGSVDACKHCKEYIIGKQFTVLSQAPEHPTYEDEMKSVWAGKTNYGRKVATYAPCAPMHPNCRCRWHRISMFYKMDGEGKFVLKSTAELINEERAKRGLAPDPNL